ncbi:DUF4465 domain-containing protein [Methylomonas koyamae]|uniref:DUF4465 domain-containing protein n=1 Tax=Methylomonas koyamae TaxID=702114 RepID=UPI000BC2FC01|nr:DUF4465 domain-containing protein [Methylomonas koyamae]ATG88541.1 hypothetical protein MKLM6_0259 [Methylomonas koyamae]
MKTILSTILLDLALASGAQASVSNFDDLNLAPNSYWAGTVDPTVPLYEPTVGSFSSGPATFNNQITDWGGLTSWTGWAYSNMTDTVTAGYTNQYSTFAGQAHSGANFGVGNFGVAYNYNPGDAAISFDSPVAAQGFYVTNTTYTALSMLNGDSFAKKFGGASGNDADWLKLSISGWNGSTETGSVDYYLADYRFGNNALDYVVNSWQWVDLSSLGSITGLKFAITSSDVGQFGMNTPAYFAMDDLSVTAVPLPAAFWLMAGALAVWFPLGRRPV